MNHLPEIFKVFFKLGIFAFGGPAAHIALMDNEIIQKRKWMTSQEFLDLIGATNIIPGPNSTEMTMHCGYVRGGRIGLFVAGISFIFPAVVITALLAYMYVNYGSLPEIAPWINGITPAVLAVIAAAVFKLGKKALKNWELAIIGILVHYFGYTCNNHRYFSKIFKSRVHPLWKRLCTVWLSKARTRRVRSIVRNRIDKSYRIWAVYSWACSLYCHLHRFSARRVQRRSGSHYRNFSTFISIRAHISQVHAADEKN